MKQREIKFRVWNGGEMVHDITTGKFGTFYVNPGSRGDGLDERDSASLTPFNTKYSEPVRLMLSTGLLDREGTEIYEGDIVEAVAGLRGVVTWFHELALFTLRTKMYNEDGDLTIYSRQENGRNMNRLIVGNIYANPELLNA